MLKQQERLEKLRWELHERSRLNLSSLEGKPSDYIFNQFKKEATRDIIGDFEYIQDEGGDSYPTRDDDGNYYYNFDAINYGRKGNNFWIEIMQGDMDGDWESIYYLDDYENNRNMKLEKEPNGGYPVGITTLWHTRSDAYFYSWLSYYMEMAELTIETGEKTEKLGLAHWVDPNSQRQKEGKTPEQWADYCLDAVEENIKYLKLGELRV